MGRTLRIAAPIVVVGAIAALRPEIVRGTFSSATSVARVVAVVLAWLAFSWIVRRLVRPTAVGVAILGVAGAGLLWFTVVPYFQDETVDDTLPAVATPASVPTPAAAPTPDSPPAPTGPQKLATGSLRGLAGHRGSGDATVYRQPDGSFLIRLEEFDVSNVPAPVLYVVPGAGRDGPGGGVKLGGLRGNQGNQNFTVPAGTDLQGPQTVLIWCEAFSVPVAAATTSVS